MKTRDWLLITVNAAGDEGLSPVQLQKTLFLIGQTLNLKSFYNFTPYSYGPFDSQVYSDAEELSANGQININYDKARTYPRYIISDKGQDQSVVLEKKIKNTEVELVHKTTEFVKRLSFKQLLKIVYEAYPSFAVNSIFKG